MAVVIVCTLASIFSSIVIIIFFLVTRRPGQREWSSGRGRKKQGLGTKYSFRGRHCVVTGGSSGIGERVAAILLERGASVTIIARRKKALEEAAVRLATENNVFRSVNKSSHHGNNSDNNCNDNSKHNDEVCTFGNIDEARLGVAIADVTDYQKLRRVIEAAEMRRGRSSIVVCSAGMSNPRAFHYSHTSNAPQGVSNGNSHAQFRIGARASLSRAEEDICRCKEHMRVNWEGCINTVHATLESITSYGDEGRIVLVSSQAGQVGLFGYSGYSSSKYALRGFAEALQMEVIGMSGNGNGICKVCVAYPPDTDTPQLAKESESKPEELTAITDNGTEPFSATRVAQAIVRGTERGQFSIPIGLDGWMLSILTSGMSPASDGDAMGSLLTVSLMGLFRMVALVYLYSWYNALSKIVKTRMAKSKAY